MNPGGRNLPPGLTDRDRENIDAEINSLAPGQTDIVPNWSPLEKRLGKGNARLDDWMWMQHRNGLEYFKHRLTRKYLVLDPEGNAYIGGWMQVRDFWQHYRKQCRNGVSHND